MINRLQISFHDGIVSGVREHETVKETEQVMNPHTIGPLNPPVISRSSSVSRNVSARLNDASGESLMIHGLPTNFLDLGHDIVLMSACRARKKYTSFVGAYNRTTGKFHFFAGSTLTNVLPSVGIVGLMIMLLLLMTSLSYDNYGVVSSSNNDKFSIAAILIAQLMIPVWILRLLYRYMFLFPALRRYFKSGIQSGYLSPQNGAPPRMIDFSGIDFKNDRLIKKLSFIIVLPIAIGLTIRSLY